MCWSPLVQKSPISKFEKHTEMTVVFSKPDPDNQLWGDHQVEWRLPRLGPRRVSSRHDMSFSFCPGRPSDLPRCTLIYLNLSSYGNITSTRLPWETVWTPDIVLYNAAGDGEQGREMRTLIQVAHTHKYAYTHVYAVYYTHTFTQTHTLKHVLHTHSYMWQ